MVTDVPGNPDRHQSIGPTTQKDTLFAQIFGNDGTAGRLALNRCKNPFNPSKITGMIPDALERYDASANALLMTVDRAGEVRRFYRIADTSDSP